MSTTPDPIRPYDPRSADAPHAGNPQPGDTITVNQRGRWFEVTAVSPGGYHISGYVGYDRSRHGFVSGVRLSDTLAWVKGERAFFPMPHEAGEDSPS